MDFPQSISFTITNRCNLRCQMCGQWSQEGYMHGRKERLAQEMVLADWKRLVDELADHGIPALLLRGGEPFLFPDIIALLEYINSKGIFCAIDTNGTMLKTYAAEIVHIGNIHLTVSVDGPQEIHDQVRGVEGCFERIREGLAQLDEIESGSSQKISRSICFTISRYSYHGLGAMPDVARSLGINSVAIVPYYFVPEHVGKEYENELQTHFGCPAFSWRGFHHADSGVEIDSFLEQYRTYLSNLGGIHNYPYMAFSEDDYRIWFGDPTTPVGIGHCPNVERLIDIQPQGKANFCVDFPDYEIGNVMDATIEALWNSERAQRFREYRRKQPLAICHRCGSKYMSA